MWGCCFGSIGEAAATACNQRERGAATPSPEKQPAAELPDEGRERLTAAATAATAAAAAAAAAAQALPAQPGPTAATAAVGAAPDAHPSDVLRVRMVEISVSSDTIGACMRSETKQEQKPLQPPAQKQKAPSAPHLRYDALHAMLPQSPTWNWEGGQAMLTSPTGRALQQVQLPRHDIEFVEHGTGLSEGVAQAHADPGKATALRAHEYRTERKQASVFLNAGSMLAAELVNGTASAVQRPCSKAELLRNLESSSGGKSLNKALDMIMESRAMRSSNSGGSGMYDGSSTAGGSGMLNSSLGSRNVSMYAAKMGCEIVEEPSRGTDLVACANRVKNEEYQRKLQNLVNVKGGKNLSNILEDVLNARNCQKSP
eukprot:178106-Chlamydomonas_euryale.AAC.1